MRPATDAMRQAVFSSLAARVEGARFLDLFAGSGAYGLEALSRGALGGVFVERDARTAAFIRQNLESVCKSLGRDLNGLEIFTTDATTITPGGKPPDLVFIDPPYEIISAVAPKLFRTLDALVAGVADPLVVFEMPGECEVTPPGWTCIKRLGKGRRQPSAAFFRKAPISPGAG